MKIALPLALALAVLSTGAVRASESAADPAASLVRRAAASLDLSTESFTLANGLRVVVHTDRKAPVVAVSVRYAVGSRNEPPDRIGFAHLFEHLMFAGSDHVPGGFYPVMRDLGASRVNGNTGYDSTVFYETVPTAALARALFVEADRMGHMDRTIDQAALDVNRGVVRNEKRQTDNQPGGTAFYRAFDRLFPAGHPYGHPVQGSLAALDAATVADARAWHRRYYVPRNAVLALAGDIDAAQARVLVERYFGALPGGERAPVPPVPIPALAAPAADTVTDQVPQTTVTRYWTTPGFLAREGPALDVAAKLLGTLTDAWLDRALIRDGHLVTAVMTSSGASADHGTFLLSYTLAPGADPALAAQRVDAVLRRFMSEGPTAEEIRRVVMRDLGMAAQTLETADGQAAALGDGVLMAGDAGYFHRQLVAAAALSPQDVRDAARRWLSRPAYTLTLAPGPRTASEPEAQPTRSPAPPPSPATPVASAALPPIGPAAPVRFPAVSRSTLSNGIPLLVAQRTGAALTRMAMTFDGGRSADAPGEAGAQAMMLAMLGEGTRTRDAAQIARDREALGASLWFEADMDQSLGTLVVPSAGMDPALDLFADMVRNPAFSPAAVAHVGSNRAALARRQQGDPAQIARGVMAPLLYGAGSAYARADGGDDEAVVAHLSAPRLAGLHDAWIRPDKATLLVVSDLPVDTIRAAAERAFGNWRGTGAPGCLSVTTRAAAAPRIVVVDRPGSVQSTILGAVATPLDGRMAAARVFATMVSNDALGGPGGRINQDLREHNGWSYGAGASFVPLVHAMPFVVSTAVQTDRTGDAIDHIRRHLTDYAGPRPIDPAELGRTIAAALVALPGRFESGDTVLSTMRADALFDRPDDYPASLAERYRALDREQLAAAFRTAVDPARMSWVVVGDAKKVEPSLVALGLPMDRIELTGTAAVRRLEAPLGGTGVALWRRRGVHLHRARPAIPLCAAGCRAARSHPSSLRFVSEWPRMGQRRPRALVR